MFFSVLCDGFFSITVPIQFKPFNSSYLNTNSLSTWRTFTWFLVSMDYGLQWTFKRMVLFLVDVKIQRLVLSDWVLLWGNHQQRNLVVDDYSCRFHELVYLCNLEEDTYEELLHYMKKLTRWCAEEYVEPFHMDEVDEALCWRSTWKV